MARAGEAETVYFKRACESCNVREIVYVKTEEGNGSVGGGVAKEEQKKEGKKTDSL